MEKENKYYTPSIEEFHAGFEYEYKSFVSKAIAKNKYLNNTFTQWMKKTFTAGSNDVMGSEIDDIDFLISKSNIRVKYLDKEDIEECGWKRDTNMDSGEHPSLYDQHGYSSAYSIDKQDTDLNTVWQLYHFPDNYVVIERAINGGTGRYDVLFVGVVKNKSEFKRILKQIGIL